jgi:uncharacterized protein (TIGR03437 family)
MTITCGLRQHPSCSFRSAFHFILTIAIFLLLYAGLPSATRAATLTVPAGGDLQSAINAAQPGDTILLEAGASFIGPFTLTAKSSPNTDSSFITIRTSAPDSALPAANERISPSYAAVLPKLLSPGNNLPALETAAYAHHYRFIGVEFAPKDASVYVREIIRLGDGSRSQNTMEMVPHHLILDRCYIHAHPTQDTIRGIALNSAETSIINSYISEFHSKGFDAQAIWGWNGPGPFKVVNNYLEASGENFGFGGTVPGVPGLVPSDIEFKRNLVSRPLSWRGQWQIKNLFELKAGQRVMVEGNIFENNWADAQAGFAVQLTITNEEGMVPWNVIKDVTFQHNIFRHCGGGFNLLGINNLYPAQQMTNIKIVNNLLEDINGSKWGGSGYFIQMTTTANVTVDHNTVLHSGNMVMAYETTNNPGPSPGFVMTNNIMEHNDYGIFGGGQSPGMASINFYFPGGDFRRNVMVGANSGRYPSDNYYPPQLDDVKFVDSTSSNYRLASTSPYVSGGMDGKAVGCDFNALATAMNGSGGQTAPLASPQLVSGALASATTLANNTGNSPEQISSLVNSIAQAYDAFIREAGQFSAASQIDSGLRVALYFSRAASALAAAEGPSSMSVRNRLQIAAAQLSRVNDLMAAEASTTLRIESAHASSTNFALVIGLADTRSGASYTNVLAPGSLGAILGDPNQSPLAMQTAFAERASSGTLPYELAGVSVTIGGRAALLVSVSPSRLSFVVPRDLPSGEAEVIVTLQEGYVSRGMTNITQVAPGIFTNAGAGVALNAATYKTGPFEVTTPEALGMDKQTRLMLFTTGFSNGVANTNSSNDVRVANLTMANLAEAVTVEARLGNGSVIRLPVEFAGTQSLGIDQVNVVLPDSLRGAGTISLTLVIGDKRSNAATITVN